MILIRVAGNVLGGKCLSSNRTQYNSRIFLLFVFLSLVSLQLLYLPVISVDEVHDFVDVSGCFIKLCTIRKGNDVWKF